MSSKRKEQTKFIQKMSKKKDKEHGCHFGKAEIEKLLNIFNKYVEGIPGKKMDRNMFRDILHNMFCMTDDMLLDRVFRVFDKDCDNQINAHEWVTGLSVFLKGTQEEQAKYTFEIYDLNGDGYITREELFQLLKACLVKQPTEEDPDEGTKDLVEIALKLADMDHDSRISFADYKEAIKNDSSVLELFGPCLPSTEVKEATLNLIGDEGTMKY